MPTIYEVQFFPEGRVANFAGSHRNVYALAPGVRLSMRTTPVWCRECHGVSNGERIDSLEEIDRLLADLSDPNSKAYRLFADSVDRDGFLQGMRQDALHRRRWRETRSAPPKCIRCGSTAVFVVPLREPFANPDGPGTIELRPVGMYTENFGGGDPYQYFTPEGDRILSNAGESTNSV
jgi:hypothetical protein